MPSGGRISNLIEKANQLEKDIQRASIEAIRRVPGVAGVMRISPLSGRMRGGGFYRAYKMWFRGEEEVRTSGVPDLLVFYTGGSVLLIEQKKPGEKVGDGKRNAAQREVLEWASLNAIPAEVVQTADEAYVAACRHSPNCSI